MQWLHSAWAWGLVVVPLMVATLHWSERKKRIALGQFAPWLYTPLSRWRRRAVRYCVPIACLCGVVVLMAPATPSASVCAEGEDELLAETEEMHEMEVTRMAHDVIVLLDASASMSVADTRLGVERLEFAKEILDTLVSQLDGQAVALYAFTSELTTVVPLTMDYLYTRFMLRQVQINQGDVAGTDLMEAFDGIRMRHERGGMKKARTVILVTDGGDTKLEAAGPDERTRQIAALRSRLDDPKVPFTLLTVGIGSHQGAVIPGVESDGNPVFSTLDEDLLKQLSTIGKGRYFFANDTSSYVLTNSLLGHLALTEDEVQKRQVPKVEVNRAEELQEPVDYEHHFRLPLALACFALTVRLFVSHHPKKEQQ